MTLAEVAPASAATLLSASAVRARSRNILSAALAGRTRHFRVDRSCIDAAAEVVERVARRRYPSLAIPYHSRWRHFEAGGVDRGAELTRMLAGRDAAACARSRIDLALVSVLLDAGAGSAWRYAEAESGQIFTRSEGLGVASFRAFVAGAFSSRRDDPLRVDSDALAKIDAAVLGRWFQVRDDNPLLGVDGRAKLLRRLGAALQNEHSTFGDETRPGGLYDALTAAHGARIPAAALLRALLDALGGIWLAGNTLDGVALGDTWRHPCAGGDGMTAGWVPFHKLSQWLAYSLFEPFEWAGARVVDQDALTGLPEYRNGGLLLDSSVLVLADSAAARAAHDVGSELVVEWRALTVALIDEVASRVRERLARPDLPLACVLEGGTWAAGRELAQTLRGGDPPLMIRSDGTVF